MDGECVCVYVCVCVCVCVCEMERDGHSKGCEEKGLNENRAEIATPKLNKN